MNLLSRAYTAMRLRLLGPIVSARGAWLRLRDPGRSATRDASLDRTPILILGCHRSGTSLLRRCLNSHSRISCPPETLFLESLAQMLDYPRAEDGLDAIGMTREEAAEDLRETVDRWMRRHAARQGKHRWADKSPGVLAHLDGLDQLVGPRAQYVAIVRDGMDVATSLGRGGKKVWWQLEPFLGPDGDATLAAGRYWVDRNRKLRRFVEANPQRIHVLRYEQLVRDPEPTLRAMFGFLGERFEPEVLDFNRHVHAGGLEDHHVRTTTTFEDNSGKHRRLRQALQVKLWDIVGEEMVAHGYPERTYATV